MGRSARWVGDGAWGGSAMGLGDVRVTERERERGTDWAMGLGVGRRNKSAMRELAGELRDEAAVGRASASVSLRDGESEPNSFREVRWRDGSLRVMRERMVR